jgi:hypothetical protein
MSMSPRMKYTIINIIWPYFHHKMLVCTEAYSDNLTMPWFSDINMFFQFHVLLLAHAGIVIKVENFSLIFFFTAVQHGP